MHDPWPFISRTSKTRYIQCTLFFFFLLGGGGGGGVGGVGKGTVVEIAGKEFTPVWLKKSWYIYLQVLVLNARHLYKWLCLLR